MTIQVDASQVGLGVALLQNHKPMAFASKALTDAKCCYTNTEREILTVVFRPERFRTYVYGRSFTIESDHKSMESISQKDLADMPAWLQCMLLCLQGYDYILHYCPDKEMALSNALSHFSPSSGPDIPLDIAIHHARLSPDWKEAFQQAFMSDAEMCALADIIITSWPDDIKEVPHPLHPYWQHYETLTVKDGLVLWGEALIVPPSERERILHQLHQFHQGIVHVWMYLLAWYKQSHWRNCSSMWDLHPFPSSECFNTPHSCTTSVLPMADVQPQDIFTLEGADYPSYVVTSIQRWSSSNTFHLARATPPMLSHCSRKCPQSMESWKSFTLTMVLNMLVPSFLSSAPLGVSPMRPQALTIHNQLDLQRHV